MKTILGCGSVDRLDGLERGYCRWGGVHFICLWYM